MLEFCFLSMLYNDKKLTHKHAIKFLTYSHKH